MGFRFFRQSKSGCVWLISAASILAALAVCAFTIGAIERRNTDAHYYHPPGEPSTAHGLVASRIKLIQLYRVDQGKLEKLVLTPSDLQTGSYLEIDGYVSGIVALCKGKITVSVDGQPMPPIRIGADGVISLRNFDSLSQADFSSSAGPMNYELEQLKTSFTEQHPSILPGGYAFFPAVFGDAVSPELRFNISFNADGKKMDFTVQQNGYTGLCAVVPEQLLGREPIPFCYAGKPGAAYDPMSAEIDGRIRTIAKGIGAVESAFSANLVGGVTIIDADGRHNAVTRKGLRRIWFYSITFLGEPLEELGVIAEHESLHILIDLLQLTQRTEIRELFADLKGYDDLSRERFELVTTGQTPPSPLGDQSKHALLFAFISEDHFLKGMKGGHPQADPEEFCTSFLHSLMHIERFGDAISEPLGTPQSTPRSLSIKEKRELVQDYLRTIEVFDKILTDRGPQAGLLSPTSAMHLSSRLVQARAALLQRLL